MTVRRAENKDADAVLNLLRQVNKLHFDVRPDLFRPGTKYDKLQLEEIFADENRPVFVADDGNRVVGYAFCVISRNTSPILADVATLYIDDLCVDEGYRGKRIGTLLLEHVTKYAKEAGCYNITLNVWTGNDAAMKFYASSDFTPLKICMEKKL